MKTFNIQYQGGDTIQVETNSAREAARIARNNGRDLLKHNGTSSMYWVWDETGDNLLYCVHTFKVENRMKTTISNCQKHESK